MDTNLGSIQLVSRRQTPIKQLQGFQKHHRIPTGNSATDQRFVFDIVQEQLDTELQETFGALRKAYGLKRREIQVEGPTEGCGSIITPFFRFDTQVFQLEDQPSLAQVQKFISNVTESARIFAGPFDQVFGTQFSEVEASTGNQLILEDIVDHIEDLESNELDLDYDKDLTWCEIQLRDQACSLRLTPTEIRFTSHREISPQPLLEMFLNCQSRFISGLNLSNNPLLSPSE